MKINGERFAVEHSLMPPVAENKPPANRGGSDIGTIELLFVFFVPLCGQLRTGLPAHVAHGVEGDHVEVRVDLVSITDVFR